MLLRTKNTQEKFYKMRMNKEFPKGFLWGSSTAAYQVEGGIENVDWAEAARNGKVPVCGKAADHYNRFEEDFDLLVNLSQNAHRFSIEWARIEPIEGKFDEEQIEHYRKVLQALKRRGIFPVVNLWHFTLPLWFSESGGFFREDGEKKFARFCAFVFERLADDASGMWITINEPEIWSMKSFVEGVWPPFGRNPFAAISMVKHLSKAHKAAYVAMKKIRPNAKIGVAKHNIYFDASRNILFRPIAAFISWLWNRWFLDMIEGHQDFIGMNHYLHKPIGWKAKSDVVRSDMGWEVHPESIYRCLLELKRYNLPIYVTESGIADAKDAMRKDFIVGYLHAVHRAIAEGADVRGYFHWSLLDNYEWALGFEKRFGLVEVNYETQVRTIRPSARVYAEICRTGTLPEANSS